MEILDNVFSRKNMYEGGWQVLVLAAIRLEYPSLGMDSAAAVGPIHRRRSMKRLDASASAAGLDFAAVANTKPTKGLNGCETVS